VVVESVHVDVDRTRAIHVLTAVDWVGVCPERTERSSRSKGWVITCHDVVIATTTDPALAAEPEGVTVLGIDETRRGKAKWENCSKTGVRRWVDPRIPGWSLSRARVACWRRVNGRAAKPVTDWLNKREQTWTTNIEFVAIDMRARPTPRPRTRRCHTRS